MNIDTIVSELRTISWDRYSAGGQFTTLGLAGETRPEYTQESIAMLWGNRSYRDSRITPSNRRGEDGIYSVFKTPTTFQDWLAQWTLELKFIPIGGVIDIAHAVADCVHEYSTSHDTLFMKKIDESTWEIALTTFWDNGSPLDGSYRIESKTESIGTLSI